jgi:hypothetical protein
MSTDPWVDRIGRGLKLNHERLLDSIMGEIMALEVDALMYERKCK